MAIKKIPWENKDGVIPYGTRINQIQDRDLNEAKDVIDNNADELQTTQDKVGVLEGITSGTLEYTSIADAMAVIPLPSDNIPFIVRGSTGGSEDGYYVYLAAETGGYFKTGDFKTPGLTQTLEPTNTTEAPSNKAVYISENGNNITLNSLIQTYKEKIFKEPVILQGFNTSQTQLLSDGTDLKGIFKNIIITSDYEYAFNSIEGDSRKYYLWKFDTSTNEIQFVYNNNLNNPTVFTITGTDLTDLVTKLKSHIVNLDGFDVEVRIDIDVAEWNGISVGLKSTGYDYTTAFNVVRNYQPLLESSLGDSKTKNVNAAILQDFGDWLVVNKPYPSHPFQESVTDANMLQMTPKIAYFNWTDDSGLYYDYRLRKSNLSSYNKFDLVALRVSDDVQVTVAETLLQIGAEAGNDLWQVFNGIPLTAENITFEILTKSSIAIPRFNMNPQTWWRLQSPYFETKDKYFTSIEQNSLKHKLIENKKVGVDANFYNSFPTPFFNQISSLYLYENDYITFLRSTNVIHSINEYPVIDYFDVVGRTGWMSKTKLRETGSDVYLDSVFRISKKQLEVNKNANYLNLGFYIYSDVESSVKSFEVSVSNEGGTVSQAFSRNGVSLISNQWNWVTVSILLPDTEIKDIHTYYTFPNPDVLQGSYVTNILTGLVVNLSDTANKIEEIGWQDESNLNINPYNNFANIISKQATITDALIKNLRTKDIDSDLEFDFVDTILTTTQAIEFKTKSTVPTTGTYLFYDGIDLKLSIDGVHKVITLTT